MDLVRVGPARQKIVELIVKFITVGFIVKDLLIYFANTVFLQCLW